MGTRAPVSSLSRTVVPLQSARPTETSSNDAPTCKPNRLQAHCVSLKNRMPTCENAAGAASVYTTRDVVHHEPRTIAAETAAVPLSSVGWIVPRGSV